MAELRRPLFATLDDCINVIVNLEATNSVQYLRRGNKRTKTDFSAEFTIFSAPWVIISNSSSLFAAFAPHAN